jgi:HK97 family phage major capsid protein
MTDVERLEALLKEIGGGVTAVKEETEKIKEGMARELEAIKSKQGEQDAALQLIGSQPRKEALPVPGQPGKSIEVIYKDLPAWMTPKGALGEKYKGYHLDLQGRDIGGRAEKMGIPFVTDPEFRERFARFMLDVLQGRTALSEGTAGQGGYLVPDEYEPVILAFAREKSQIALPLCWVLPMGSDTKRVPAEASGADVAWTAEATAATESTGPTVGEAVLAAKRLTGYKEASNELIDDSMFDIVSWLTELFGEAIGLELDNQVLNGTGSPCSGVLTAKAGYSVVMGSGSAAFSMLGGDDLSSMLSKLKESVLGNAYFVLHRTVFHYVRTIKNADGTYMYGPLMGPDPQSIWGLPYIRSEKAPSTSGASTALAVLGNFKFFVIGRRQGDMKLFVNPYSLDKENQTRFKVETRWGLAVGQANAFVRYITAAS